MAFTTPGTAVAGDVLTAAFWNEQVRDNMLMGNPVFTNEAARDAVITAPSEGQRAYLTAPTIPAATGVGTLIPSGITTIYNGSVWVCTTEISAFNTATDTATASTSFVNTLTNDGTAISVTLVTGTTALVTLGTNFGFTAAAVAHVSFAVSGATTIAAADDNGMFQTANVNYFFSGQSTKTFIFSGLTAGTNTFTLSYRTTAGTQNFRNRNLIVRGVA
jgi:hypothetical protein